MSLASGRKRRVRVAAVVGAVGLGLGVLASQVSCGCTAAACGFGLRVHVSDASGAPVQRFAGEARFAGRTVSFRCDGTLSGEQGFMCLEGEVQLFEPSGDVELEVHAEGAGATGSFQGTLQPDYTTSTPNGPLCPPTCQDAEVAVTLR